jgi:hypothetical protein
MVSSPESPFSIPCPVQATFLLTPTFRGRSMPFGGWNIKGNAMATKGMSR